MSSPRKEAEARLYVCGITPYDATHLGHAATYVAFDVLVRVWRDAGIAVNYVQNTTDVDDPLLERATATGVDWQELAREQTELYFADMEALRVIPPDSYIGAVESVDRIVAAVQRLRTEDLVKPPGVAETLDWVAALQRLGSPELDLETAARTLGAVIKYREDAERVRQALDRVLAR